jgi:hypothetical protein
MKKSFVLTVVALFTFSSISAFSQSSKAAWQFKEVIALTANSGGTEDTGWVDILQANIKTPNAKEIAIGASLQVGLVTDTTVKSKNGDLDSSAARGKISVRIKLITPNGDTVYAQPSNGADLRGITDIPMAAEGVTYADRYQKLAAKFSGLHCTANLTTGAVTCVDPEELQLILQTLSAHHFNFLYANATPGVHQVIVQARAQAGMELGGTVLGSASAEAFAGAGAVSVESIRLVKAADGTAPVEIN